ncbi:MAG: thiamine biosynthesis protein ThiS [Candidatus Lambdaproteobacteria bacterium RIFOXYD1_FULL_56_27]|uniref:Thiamine biosynthesis protein ThiS n=1 Tax=Candidatus Lambdaproteobacteria bacterium RIFOXYD2_FULL_56_26 TaxID=1817773 RepID=A0A1F6GZQ1_9PROT|nr:MAG: thiamine biosynthesis protein ThiS [Candidatus Lambdaproteobacteria bacterium RIFOXYD2_FULL_56_26]OGH04232.1 MAG: thiamine biosynthesis protein ThiS [Candidatus Lambdaproteobacteria bacterium RIFOXYC1_FULL_56_13]OGH08874.1 MAG: thiamine biosynthesis protein ThiS [Candidatus Lambdaproteobacteria bacterium RIFOXYD1_FULL_56_27]
MELLLNSQKVLFGGENLFEFLALQGACERKGIAVAVNEEVIAKEDWLQFALQPGDQILIIQPTQGG